MNRKQKILCLVVACGLLIFPEVIPQTVRIMPLGNSITFDSNSLDNSNPRPDGDRISYRYKLYQLLTAAGFTFDYVGSEDAGNNYFQNPELDDNAGFPGIQDDQLAYLLTTGYNLYSGLQVSPGPYLVSYPADIILLHIGTNGLDESPSDVEDILNEIRFYDSDVIILVAKIINRRTYSETTTTFNNNVTAMVNARGDNRIIMVDMENGAGINYSTDMADDLHPNQTGYEKMAYKWFEAINNLNHVPVISTIPTQITNEGSAFSNLTLDDYVTDPEDPDYLITWSFRQPANPHLSVTLDANRILHVSPVDTDWNGSENIVLKAADTGNGAFKKTDSVQVMFTVNPVNDPPVILDQNPIDFNEDTNYEIRLSDLIVQDIDNPPSDFTITVQSGSNYTVNARTITPALNFNGTLNVGVKVYDKHDYSNLFILTATVNPVNDPPLINSQTYVPSATEHIPFTIDKSYLSYQDVDNNPEDIELFVFPGENYIYSGLTITSNEGFSGELHVNVKLKDITSYSSIFVMNVNVASGSKPPVFTTIPDTIAHEYVTYSYQPTATDPNDDALHFSASTLPDWLSFDPDIPLLYGTPSSNNIGKSYVCLSVTDNKFLVQQCFYIDVLEVNEPPVITSLPVITSDDYVSYQYIILASDADADTLYYFSVQIPSWLSFDENIHLLYGTPEWYNANNYYDVSLGVTDKTDTVYQNFTIFVSNTDDPPEFTSTPDTVAWVDSTYSYSITFFDKDEDDQPSLSVLESPGWLSFNAMTNKLWGVPVSTLTNNRPQVVMQLTDGKRITVQAFYIHINNLSEVQEMSGLKFLSIYPLPAREHITVDFMPFNENSELNIWDETGRLIKSVQLAPGTNSLKIDMSSFHPGLYIMTIKTSQGIYAGKFLAD